MIMEDVFQRYPEAVGISAERLMCAVADIAALGARIAGSAEEEQAARYISKRLSAAHIANEIVEFETFVHWPNEASITIEGQEDQRIEAAGVAFAKSTGVEPLLGRLADLRAGDDPQGRIVLIDGLTHYDTCLKGFQTGAIGVIGISTGKQKHNWQISPLWGAPRSQNDIAALSPLPAVQVNAPDGAFLRKLARTDTRIALSAQTNAGWRKVRMPVAEIPGEEPYFVLVGGHYCSWGPGATDNATGNALMLELAELLAAGERPRYGVRFCWWTGHEHGGYAGSSWYADHHWSELKSKAIAYLNVDNLGSRGAIIKILQNTTAELSGYVKNVIEKTVGLPSSEARTFKGWLQRQDKYIDRSRCGRNGDQSFSGIGLPSAQISSYLPASDPDQIPGSGMGWWWHTSEDLPQYASAEILAVDTLLYWNLLSGLINASVFPFDLTTVGNDFLASIRGYEEYAPGLPELTWLTELAEVFRKLTTALKLEPVVETREASGERNLLLLRVLKLLNPVLHHSLNEYEYDASRRSLLLPSLQNVFLLGKETDDDDRMTMVGLRRKANRIGQALADASDLIRMTAMV